MRRVIEDVDDDEGLKCVVCAKPNPSLRCLRSLSSSGLLRRDVPLKFRTAQPPHAQDQRFVRMHFPGDGGLSLQSQDPTRKINGQPAGNHTSAELRSFLALKIT